MGIVSRALSAEKRNISLSDLDKIIEYGYYGPPNTATGLNVNEFTALKSIGVCTCVLIISQTLATLPIKMFERQDAGRREARELSLYYLLHDQPNPEMSAYKYKETKQGHLCTWGNAYSEIEWDMSNGTIKALWPLRPDRMQVTRENGKLWYVYTLPNGTKAGLPAYRIFHVKGFGFNGLTGYSPIGLAREAIALDMAAERYGGKFFSNDARPGGVIKHPKVLSPEARATLRESWRKMHQGLDNAHRIAILDEGMEWQQIGLPNKDIEFIENRKFQKAEIATLYRVPLHMVNMQEKSTSWGSGIAQMTQGFIDFTMLPWMENWEQEIKIKLLLPKDRVKYYAEFVTDYYLRGDPKDRAEYQSKMFNIGKYSINEMREKDNENPIGPEGDRHFVPMNMVPVDLVIKTVEEGGEEAARKLNRLVRAMDPKVSLEEWQKLEPRKKSTVRISIANSYKQMFTEAALRVIRGERRNVMKEARKLFKRSAPEFKEWLENYYREKHPQFLQQQMRPVFTSLASAIYAAAAEEIDISTDITPEAEKFLADYTDTFTSRYIRTSQGGLKNTVDRAVEEGIDPVEALEEKFDRYEETRPNKIAMRETVQINGAISTFVFFSAGYRTVWRAGGKDPCDYCLAMDGKTISRGGYFVKKGEGVNAEGQEEMLIPSGNVGHPPLHLGCECTVEPG